MRTLFLISGLCGALILSSCRRHHDDDATAEKKDTTQLLYSEFYDFESLTDGRISATKAVSGKNSAVVNNEIEYGFGFQKRFKDISSFGSIQEIHVSFKCWMDKKYADPVFVISVDDSTETKNIMWEGQPLVCQKEGAWNDITYSFKMNPDFIKPQSVLKLYVWNKGKNTFYYDDLAFDFVKLKK